MAKAKTTKKELESKLEGITLQKEHISAEMTREQEKKTQEFEALKKEKDAHIAEIRKKTDNLQKELERVTSNNDIVKGAA